MINNFHLAAIVKESAQTHLRHISLRQDLQSSLGEGWDQQYLDFVTDIEELDFDPGYRLEKHERFRLNDYVLPDWLVNETSQTFQNLDPLRDMPNHISGLVGAGRDDQGGELVLFQNFIQSRVIRPGWTIFPNADNTYVGSERPGLTLDTKLSAVYQPNLRKFLFKSFRTVNTFLPLADIYREATEEDIRQVLSHDRLATEDLDASATDANQWFSKRIAILRDMGILDQFSVYEIKAKSVGYPVDINIVNGKIIFPREKNAAKRLLQFLVEELYRGAITDTLWETNSKRQPTD